MNRMKKAVPQSLDKRLYVILPYFNYCEYGRRKQLFIEFIERIRTIPGIRILVVEATLEGTKFQLPKSIGGVFKHVGFMTQDPIWIKENLINLAIQHLPNTWQYVSWIDADVTFLNTNWVNDTVKALQEKDVVQMFQTAVHMGPDGEAMKIEKGFGYMSQTSDQPYHKDARYGFWHPGFGWAITRKAYQQMEKLVDWGILGSGDRHMALALIGKVECSYPGQISADYATKLEEYQEKCKGLTLGFVPGTILHHWHGRIEDRKYRERWQILTKYDFQPSKDCMYNKHGVLQLTEDGKRMQENLREYFAGRREDEMTK